MIEIYIVSFVVCSYFIGILSLFINNSVCKLINYCFLFLSFSFAIITTMFRVTSSAIERNDTYNYVNFMRCINNVPLSDCNEMFSIPSYEVFFGFLSEIASYFTIFGDNYISLFFIISIIISFSICCFFKNLRFNAVFAIGLLFLTGSYWEINGNIIRQALAICFFLIMLSFDIYKINDNKWVKFFQLFGVFFHSIGFIYSVILMIAKKLNIKKIIIFIILGLMSGGVLNLLSKFNLAFLGEAFLYKINRYQSSTVDVSFIKSLGVFNCLFIILLYYPVVKLKDSYYYYLYKVALLIIFFSSLFSGTEIMYRILNFLPFLLVYLSVYPLTKGRIYMFFFYYSLYMVWLFYLFFQNNEFFLNVYP